MDFRISGELINCVTRQPHLLCFVDLHPSSPSQATPAKRKKKKRPSTDQKQHRPAMGKDCGNHGDDHFRNGCRRLLAVLLFLAVIVAIICLIVYLVLRPTHPRFYLQDASLRQLDLSNASSLLSTSIQVTVASRNPNDRVGVYYDRLDVYASYKYQQITVASSLPPVYQGHGDVDVWSPVLDGPNVPFAPYLASAISQDCQAGYLILQVKIDGRVRWKVGSWISGHYHLFVTCPAFLVTSGGNGAPGASGFKFQTTTYCHVEV